MNSRPSLHSTSSDSGNLISLFSCSNPLCFGYSKIDDVTSLGQGVQRHLIYTLIKLSAKYSEKKKIKQKDFTPDLTVILFEEPEAFLHPSQQEQLNISLRELAKRSEQQVLLTTHSSTFVSKNIQDIKNIARITKENGIATIHQLDDLTLRELLDTNIGLYTHFCNKLHDTTFPDTLKGKIRNQRLGDDAPDPAKKLLEESMRYFLWLDSERANLFFAKQVLICEGASERVFLEYMMNEVWSDLKQKHIYALDALGKYNIHRFMSLFEKLGIKHSVIMDKDQDRDIHAEINTFIEGSRNGFTKHIHSFDIDFEDFLGIEKPNRDDLKPLNVIMHHKNGQIDASKLQEFRVIVDNLIR